MTGTKATEIGINLKKEIFHKVLIISIILMCLVSPFDIYVDNIPMAIFDLFSLIVFGTIYYLSKYRNMTRRLIMPYIFYFIGLVNITWYLLGGFNTPASVAFLVITYMSIVIMPKKYLNQIIFFLMFNVLVLAIAEYLYPKLRAVPESLWIGMILTYFYIIMALFFTTFLLIYVKDLYDWGRDLLYTQRKILGEQSEELTILNSKLKSLNMELEQEVEKRTHKLVDKNKKRIDYALKNSHNVRGPLSRIIGLTNLIKNGVLDEDELKQSMQYIKTSIEELDGEIAKVNEQLEEELF